MSVKTAPCSNDDPSLHRVAARLVRDEPALLSSLEFGPSVRQGVGQGRSLIVGDQAGTELFTPDRAGFRDHRMALLAKPGDVIVVRRRVRGFEDYLEECLDIHSVTYLEAHEQDLTSVAEQCRSDPSLHQHLLEALGPAPSVTIQPYLCHGHVWRLAGDLAAMNNYRIHVAGPSPRTCRRTNDKAWFWQLVCDVLGKKAVPPTLLAFSLAAAAAQIAHVARTNADIVVKVPSSAGGAGNIRVDASLLAGMTLSNIRDLLLRRLSAIGWGRSFPVLVGVWESGVQASPSAQLRIPRVDEGPPELLGIFEQRIEGGEGAFVGAARSRLSSSVEARMVEEAMKIGFVLQRIGYFGPCSLDAVLCRRTPADSDLHWIECNGRWSGVSIPLAAATRLLGARPPGLLIIQEELPGPGRLTMAKLRQRLGDLVFNRGNTTEGVIILAPPDERSAAFFCAAAIAESQESAGKVMAAACDRLRSQR